MSISKDGEVEGTGKEAEVGAETSRQEASRAATISRVCVCGEIICIAALCEICHKIRS